MDIEREIEGEREETKTRPHSLRHGCESMHSDG